MINIDSIIEIIPALLVIGGLPLVIMMTAKLAVDVAMERLDKNDKGAKKWTK